MAPKKRKLEEVETAGPLPSKRARIYGHPKLLGGTSRQGRKVVLDSDDEDDTAVQQSKEETEEHSSGSTSSPRKSANDNDGDDDTAIPEPKKSAEDNSSGTANSPRKSVDDEAAETIADKGSEPASSSPRTDDTTPSEEKSSSGSAGSPCKPASDSDNTADTTPPATSTPETGDEAAESSTKTDEASEKVSKKSTRATEKKARHIHGLLNNSEQCFANSTIQLFDAALDGHDLNAVLGNTESTSPFTHPKISLDDGYAVKPKNTRRSKAKSQAKGSAQEPMSKLGKMKAAIKDRITKAVKAGKLKDVSPKKHLRSLLHYMRSWKGEGHPRWVTPFLFQQILAHGDEDASPPRAHMDGVEQQDCYEYFQAVLNGVDESATESSASLSSLFDITSETATVCTNPDCDHKGEATAQTSHSVSVAVSKKKLGLMELLEASNASELDLACPKCDQETLERRTEFTEASENFVVHLNRIGPDLVSKIRTAVDLPLQKVQIAGKQFVLNAVLRHRGDTVHAGHYTIVRRRSSEWTTDEKSLWFDFNDADVEPVQMSQVRDYPGRFGFQSVMLLFKAL